MTDEIEIPPHSIDAERSTLGCQIMGGQAVEIVREILDPADFHLDLHKIMQRTIFNVADHNDGNVDVLLVCDELLAKGKLDDVGGPAFVQDLMESVPYRDHVAIYAEKVKEYSRRRKVIDIGRQLVKKAHDKSLDVKEIAEAANDAAMKISESLKESKTRPKMLSDHVWQSFEVHKAGKASTVFWGIPSIDEMTGGFVPGELVTIAARPSMGKSMVALQWLDTAASKGIAGLMISEEMSAASLADRSLASITCLPPNEWQSQHQRVSFDIREHFADRAPILIAEKCETASGAERAIARAVQSHGIRIVAVDYAQLLRGEGDTKEQRVSDVSGRMKAAAMRHDIIVLLLAQLNRGIEGRENPSPQLADMKDSGGLEQDADVALFPFWPIKIGIDAPADSYRIYCRKNRNRGIGSAVIEMRIDPSRQRIYPASEHDEWEAAR